jgi:glucose/arabinose dehydrogenase
VVRPIAIILVIALSLLTVGFHSSATKDPSFAAPQAPIWSTVAPHKGEAGGVRLQRVRGAAAKLKPHRITLANGKTFNLNLPEGYGIKIAAQGLKRVRFMAWSPDQRIFVTDLYNRADNQRGAIYIINEVDAMSGKFSKPVPYLTRLRNPNSIAFHTDSQGQTWLYLALTDRLVRYRYRAGEMSPSSASEVLATFPDHGLNYKYGGWHLTRTIVIGGNNKLYVSVGSSCNACEEAAGDVRALVLEMDLDGKNQRAFARGLRNAVGMKWVDGQLFVTNMGADHLGNNQPDDTMYTVRENTHYGWPYYFQSQAKIQADPQFLKSSQQVPREAVPLAYAAFSAHSSPLGLEHFKAGTAAPNASDYFLVALHGSSIKRIARGYRVVRVSQGALPQDFITGFIQRGHVYGRPVDILKVGPEAFLLSDDYAGVIYCVFRVR